MQNSTCLLKNKQTQTTKKTNPEQNSVTMIFPSFAHTRKSKGSAARSPARWLLPCCAQCRVEAGLPWEALCDGQLLQVLWEPALRHPNCRLLGWARQPPGSGKATGCHSVTGTTAMAACSQVLASEQHFSAIFAVQVLPRIQSEIQICFNMVKLFLKVLRRLWYTHLTHALTPSDTMIWREQVNLPPQRLNSKQNQKHP